jgi:hypothetical protein
LAEKEIGTGSSASLNDSSQSVDLPFAFVSDDGTTQKIAERNTNEISVIVPVNKLPPTHPEFLHRLQEIGWEQL